MHLFSGEALWKLPFPRLSPGAELEVDLHIDRLHGLKLYLSHAPVLDFSPTLPDGDRLRETP